MWRFDSETVPGDWETVESPVSTTLHDLSDSVNGPVAVGNLGHVLARGVDGWELLVENGPAAESNTLHAVDSTEDGERIWFAGASGSLGYYDVPAGEREDFSNPRDLDTAFTALTVSGTRGEEKLLVADGSGNVLPGDMDDGRIDWGWASCPNGGTAINDLASDEMGYGYAIDGNSDVFVTTEDDGWKTIGIEESGASFYTCSEHAGRLLVAGGNGFIFESEEDDRRTDAIQWTPYTVGQSAVEGVDAGERGSEQAQQIDLACGGSGTLAIRMGSGEWKEVDAGTGKTLNAVLVADPMVAVGNNGVVCERQSEFHWVADEEDEQSEDEGSESEDDESEWTDDFSEDEPDDEDDDDADAPDPEDDDSDAPDEPDEDTDD